MHRLFVQLILRLLATIVLAAMLPLAETQAQAGQRCFAETGHCISGRIRAFWEQNGGLSVFGLPITAQQEESIEGKLFQVQWFERNRLELHPENGQPYDVLLGRLGVDRLAAQGRDWFTFPKSEPQADCRFFPETGHNVCGDILQTWRATGLEIDGRRGKSEAESLALFGLPLSDAQIEVIEGKEYAVQWFERARFELHPENEPPYRVLLGLLGSEIHGVSAPPPAAPAPAPSAGITLYVCDDSQAQTRSFLSESCTISAGTSTQFFIYPGDDNARDFAYPVARTVVGSSFTFKLWLGSIGTSTVNATIVLRHNDEETAVAAASFTVDSDTFREFTQTVGGGINAVAGDTLILRVSASGGEKAAVLIASNRSSTITIAP